MSLRKIERENFVSILGSDGTFRKVVPEGTEGAIVREYEDSKGNKGIKTELVFNEMEGKITGISFFDGDFGQLIKVVMTDEAGDETLSMDTSQAFAEDLMKKLPNIKLDQNVVFTPYAFVDENGKNKKGLTIKQNGEKVDNYYYNAVDKKPCNGFPEPEGDTKKFDKDDWKMYFIKVRKFLVKQTGEVFGNAPIAEVKEETVDSLVDDMLSA